ncbi:MAG: AmmeMemoRadiSam system protein A [Acidobacteriota bacterium]
MLSDSDKTALLHLARNTLETYFTRKSIPTFETESPGLLEHRGAFVSLHRFQDLRGCIGQLEADRELYKVVQQCTLSAAFADSRFRPLQPDELAELDIEISALAPFRRIQNVEEIVVGRHGLYIVRGHCRGLLLPQVASQYNWDRSMFLQQTCYKAGLPESAWEDPQTEIYTFEAEVFSEKDLSGKA